MIGSIVANIFKTLPGAQFTFDGKRLRGSFPRGGARLDLTLSAEEAEALAQTGLDLAAVIRRALRAGEEAPPDSSPVSVAPAAPVAVALPAPLPVARPAVALPAEAPKRGRPPALPKG